MADAVIWAVLLVILLVGIRASIKHFRGEGGCCGGAPVKVKKKKLKHVVKQIKIGIEGMTCSHCKARVEERLNALDGVSARVILKKKMAVVSLEKDVEEERLVKAVEGAGYKVLKILP